MYKYLLVLAPLALIGYFLVGKDEQKKIEVKPKASEIDNHQLKHYLSSQLLDPKTPFKQTISHNSKSYKVNYSTDPELESFVRKRLRYYRPDKAAIVVMDNNNGNLLVSIGFTREGKVFDYLLPFTGTHPAASVFKIVTSADLINNEDFNIHDKFKYRGRGTTLYKYQLKNKKSRWQRTTSFDKAFAYSNNVIFGKAAINNTTPEELEEMAKRLGFNDELMKEIDLAKSTFEIPQTDYAMAEIASGFNKRTQISPVHCAVLSSVVANDGILQYPRLATDLVDEQNQKVWQNEIRKDQVIGQDTAKELSELMQGTIKRGTARRTFRRYMSRRIANKLEIGGKTGSITGGFPFGKRDWFTSYAKPKNNLDDKGISVCVMIINYKKWYVKSTKLAQEIISKYYRGIK
ncbi:penicillin-binding transpeptidase domain-containing protein [Halobacteriovorax sp. XZX-3]|uniref:penicillin-binding transpeptidase domain-containing protein n=1 Tax=unclassified Halobacteriovorax TaxID=2639665 RepID=UPI0037155C26